MKPKHLFILSVVTVVLAAAAIYSVHMRNEVTEPIEKAKLLFPNLTAQINDVDAITVQNHTGKFTVKRKPDGAWVVATKYDYPARFGTVKRVIVGVSDMKTIEAKTDDPKLFGDLGLSDVTADGSKATLVELMSNGKQIASVLFGERKYSPGSGSARTYVRKPSGGRAWLVDNAPDIAADIKKWMIEETVKVPRERVKDVVLAGPDRPTLDVYRETRKEKNFKVRDMPPGAELTFDSAPNAVAGALGYISFDDVKPAKDVDFSKADTARFQTFDGLQVTAHLATSGKDTWAMFTATALPGAVTPKPASDDAGKTAADKDQTDKTGKTDQAKKKDKPLDVPAEVKAINMRVDGWAYKLADYKVQDLTKRMSDLLKKPEKKAGKSAKSAKTGS